MILAWSGQSSDNSLLDFVEKREQKHASGEVAALSEPFTQPQAHVQLMI